jgi:acyl-CoA reductase-like NAD-dependent aldehyde dehydrogenase
MPVQRLETIEFINPVTTEILIEVELASPEDVDKVVQEAAPAFPA